MSKPSKRRKTNKDHCGGDGKKRRKKSSRSSSSLVHLSSSPLSRVFDHITDDTPKTNTAATTTTTMMMNTPLQSSGSVIGSSREWVRTLRRAKRNENAPVVPDIEFIQKIGRGASGDVWEGLDKSYGIHVAVKVMVCDFFERRIAQGIMKEITIPLFCTHYSIDSHLRVEISELRNDKPSPSKRRKRKRRDLDDNATHNNNTKDQRQSRKKRKTSQKQEFASNDDDDDEQLCLSSPPSSSSSLTSVTGGGDDDGGGYQSEETETLPPAIQVAIIMPLMVMNLRTFMEAWNRYVTQSKSNGTFNPEFGFIVVQFILREILEGLWLVHQNGLLHLDIKPENILISPDGNVGIFDFGLTKYKSNSYSEEEYFQYYQQSFWKESQPKRTDDDDDDTIEGEEEELMDPLKKNNMKHNWIRTIRHEELVTAPYRSPETFCRAVNVGPHVDIWSFGCVMTELFTGRHPFLSPTKERLSKEEYHEHIIENMITTLGPPNGSLEAYMELAHLMERQRQIYQLRHTINHNNNHHHHNNNNRERIQRDITEEIFRIQSRMREIYDSPFSFLPTQNPINEYRNCKQFNISCITALSKCDVKRAPPSSSSLKNEVKQSHGAIAWDLLERILVWDYTKRLDLDEILSHKYFSYMGDCSHFTAKDFIKFIDEILSQYIPSDRIASSYRKLRVGKPDQKIYYGITNCVTMTTDPLYGGGGGSSGGFGDDYYDDDDNENSMNRDFQNLTAISEQKSRRSIFSVCNLNCDNDNIKEGQILLEMNLSSTV